MKVKNLIVGAGISGITLAQCLAEKGEEVFLVEQRNHIGGNCYDYFNEDGILVHKYGPHIFHTDLEEVRNYVNRFSEFTNYEHKVLGSIDGNLIPIPFNLNSIYLSFPRGQAENLEKALLKYFDYGSRITIRELKEKSESENDENLSFLADYIFEKVFKNYTMKQWGISAKEIDSNVINRVPVAISKDDRYFSHHKYQGMPVEGYTKMFEKMVDDPKINIYLNTKFNDIKDKIEYEKLYFTGSIDEFFDFKYGRLGYRRILYDIETLNIPSYQESSVVNYPNDYKYTRITEFKKFYPESESFDCDKTVICREFPGIGEIDAYPILSPKNLKLLKKYQEENKDSNVKFVGRLGSYSYFDMDKAINQVFEMLKKEDNLLKFAGRLGDYGYFSISKFSEQVFKVLEKVG